MILSRHEIEELADAIIKDFQRSFYGDGIDIPNRCALFTPIEQFASEYLGLEVTFERLSSDGSILGLTAYADTRYEVELASRGSYVLPIHHNQVVLDTSFMDLNNFKRLCGKRRFTLAHECAHQILFQLEDDEIRTEHKKKYAERKVHTVRALKTREDWDEWQANAMGSALLMPQSEVDRAMCSITGGKPLIQYGNYFYGKELSCLDIFCAIFGVSRSAGAIRLEQLGYLNRIDGCEIKNNMKAVR